MTHSTGQEAPRTEAQQELGDCHSTNQAVAARFLDTARLLENQWANPFRVRAYRRAAETLRRLRRPVEQIFSEEGAESEWCAGVRQNVRTTTKEPGTPTSCGPADRTFLPAS